MDRGRIQWDGRFYQVPGDRIAEGVKEMLEAHFDGKPLPDDFVMVSPDS